MREDHTDKQSLRAVPSEEGDCAESQRVIPGWVGVRKALDWRPRGTVELGLAMARHACEMIGE